MFLGLKQNVYPTPFCSDDTFYGSHLTDISNFRFVPIIIYSLNFSNEKLTGLVEAEQIKFIDIRMHCKQKTNRIVCSIITRYRVSPALFTNRQPHYAPQAMK